MPTALPPASRKPFGRQPANYAPAMLSRGVSVIRGKTLIINLPGSPKAVEESLDVFLGAIPHGLGLLRGTVENCAR